MVADERQVFDTHGTETKLFGRPTIGTHRIARKTSQFLDGLFGRRHGISGFDNNCCGVVLPYGTVLTVNRLF